MRIYKSECLDMPYTHADIMTTHHEQPAVMLRRGLLLYTQNRTVREKNI